jgi:hypothetical protein
MSSPVKLYQREMHTNLGFFATWLPGDHLELGEAGLMDGGRFRKMTSLAELGISIEKSSAGPPQKAHYESTSGTKVTFAAGAAATPGTRGEISVQFSKEGAFLFHSTGLRHTRIENRQAVATAVLNAYDAGTWKKEWCLIEGLHTAERATIIVSEDTNAEIVLAAATDLPLAGISLADPKVELNVSSTRGKLFHLIGGKQLHPLYSCLRLTDPWFGERSLEPVRGAADPGSRIMLERPSIDELLDS